MKKKWLIFSGIFGMAVIFLLVFWSTQLKIVSKMDPERNEVLSNKVWGISFSDSLDTKTVIPEHVYVLNEEGEKQNIELSLSDDQKTIIIKPPVDGYELNSPQYTLFLTKGLQSSNGRGLQTTNEFLFTVKESLPIVASIQEMNEYFLQIMNAQQQRIGIFSSEDMAVQESATSTKQMDSAASTQNYSETNVQVQGIDEGDSVKTDGTYIYKINERTLQIIGAVPADQMGMESIITYDESFLPLATFLYNDQLIVIGQNYQEMENKSSNKVAADTLIAYGGQSTKAIVYDVKNKKQPKQIREFEIEGSLVTSRLMDGKVYMISNYYPEIWQLDENPEIDLRPKYSDSVKGGELKAVDFQKIQYIPDSSEANFTNISVVDLQDPTAEMSLTSLLGSGNQVYMSKNNLYLAAPNYANVLLNTSATYSPNTNLFKFSIQAMNVELQDSTEVEGTILNQFSMDEHNGYFRIATTEGQTWDENNPSANHLFILDEHLQKVGELSDLARGERIYSARFMGDRVYIVTFKETDPLFVIDTSQPAAPKVLGELKIPGFSNYLHPLDENHLLGFGYDTKVEAVKAGNEPLILTDGVKLSLFDVSDMTNPIEKFTEIIGGKGTYSPLNYDHKALMQNKAENLFAFPITVYENIEGSQYESHYKFQGAYIYQIDEATGFTLKSKLSHMNANAVYEEWETNIDRLIYIGNQIYALSPGKITSYNLEDFEQTGELNTN